MVGVPQSKELDIFLQSPEYQDALLEPMTVAVAVVDLIRFSSAPTVKQYMKIARYQNVVREAVASNGLEALISIGDGTMFVWRESAFAGVMQHVLRVARALDQFNAAFADSQLLWRMGVHVGQAYRFRDINGQRNLVGDGLNLAQRVSVTVDDQAIMDRQQTSKIHLTSEARRALHICSCYSVDGPHERQVKQTQLTYYRYYY